VKQGTFAIPIGEAGQNRSTNKKFWRIFFCCASHIGRVRIVGPIVLAQHKGNERIGKAWTPICDASPIVIEIAYQFCHPDGNGNMFNTRQWRIKNSK
jgi:hypothetical protein